MLETFGITHVHYLSLDIEGAELEAMRSVDWDHTTIDTITAEHPSPLLISYLRERGLEPI